MLLEWQSGTFLACKKITPPEADDVPDTATSARSICKATSGIGEAFGEALMSVNVSPSKGTYYRGFCLQARPK